MLIWILFLVSIVMALIVFFRLSRMKVAGSHLMSLKYRIAIALLFPVAVFLIWLFLVIGLLIFLAILIVGVLFFLFGRYKIRKF